jgi:hypothetical protein
MLHDFSLMITLNPLVQSHRLLEAPETGLTPFPEHPFGYSRPSVDLPTSRTSTPPPRRPSPTAPDWDAEYEVTDLVSYLPFHLWDSKVVYRCKFKATNDGMASLVNAPAGVVSLASWRVIEEGGEVVLEERAEVSVSRVLARTVKGAMEESHKVIAERFLEELERKKKEGGYAEGVRRGRREGGWIRRFMLDWLKDWWLRHF